MWYLLYQIRVGEKTYIGATKNWKNRLKKHKAGLTNANSEEYHYVLYVEMRLQNMTTVPMERIRKINVETLAEARIQEQVEMDLIPQHLLINPIRAHNTQQQTEEYRASVRKHYKDKYMESVNADPVKRARYIEMRKEYNETYRANKKNKT